MNESPLNYNPSTPKINFKRKGLTSNATGFVKNSGDEPSLILVSLDKQRETTSPIIALKASGRDCTNNYELLHKIGVL